MSSAALGENFILERRRTMIKQERNPLTNWKKKLHIIINNWFCCYQIKKIPFICCLIKASPTSTNNESDGSRRYVQHHRGSPETVFLRMQCIRKTMI